jgi:hypothetical protein
MSGDENMKRGWGHSLPSGTLGSTVTSSSAKITAVDGAWYRIVSSVDCYFTWGPTGGAADANDSYLPANCPIIERAGRTNFYFHVIRKSADGIIRLSEMRPRE